MIITCKAMSSSTLQIYLNLAAPMQNWNMLVCATADIPQDCTAAARLTYAFQVRHTVLHMLLCTSNSAFLGSPVSYWASH